MLPLGRRLYHPIADIYISHISAWSVLEDADSDFSFSKFKIRYTSQPIKSDFLSPHVLHCKVSLSVTVISFGFFYLFLSNGQDMEYMNYTSVISQPTIQDLSNKIPNIQSS